MGADQEPARLEAQDVTRTVVVLLLAACTEKTRTTDTSSKTLASAAARSAFLCAYALCPTAPRDAAFHVVFHDNSRGLISGPSDGETVAVVKIDPDHAELWARGCEPRVLEARPQWVKSLLAERPEWALRSPPDAYTCREDETRLIHVKEGVVLWRVVAR